MRRAVILAALILPVSIASAASFGSSITGAAYTGCGGGYSFGPEQPPLIAGADSVSSGPCVFANIPESAQAAASVDPFSVGSTISGSGFSSGIGALGSAASTYFDTVTLKSPSIDFSGAVPVIMSDSYKLDLSGVGGLASGEASVALGIVVINGVTAPVSLRDSKGVTANGTYTGRLNVDFSISACPCSFEFELTGKADGANGASADFQDPLQITLPPGWTYTLASQETQISDAPEPGYLFAFGMALITAALMAHRLRCRKLVKTV